MRITESRLRRLIRSVIAETIDHPEHGPLYDMPDGSVMPAGDQEEIFLGRDRETDEFPRPEDEEYSDEYSEEEAEGYDDYFYSDSYARDIRDRNLTDPYMGDED